MKKNGVTIIEILLVIAMVAVLAAAHIPNFISYFGQAKDSSAKSAGRNAKLAEEIYYNDREGSIGYYTTNLDLLLEVDKNLTDDPEVTFIFEYASSTGFTLWTTHNRGTGYGFTYTD